MPYSLLAASTAVLDPAITDALTSGMENAVKIVIAVIAVVIVGTITIATTSGGAQLAIKKLKASLKSA